MTWSRTHRRAARSFVRLGISPLGMVIVKEMLVLAKALMMSGLASKILTLSMLVWVLRKLATWAGGGRLSARVP